MRIFFVMWCCMLILPLIAQSSTPSFFQYSSITDYHFICLVAEVYRTHGEVMATQLAERLALVCQRKRKTKRKKQLIIWLSVTGFMLGIGGWWYWHENKPRKDTHVSDIIEEHEEKKVVPFEPGYCDVFPSLGHDIVGDKRIPPGMKPAIQFLQRHASIMAGALRAAAHAGIAYAAVRPQTQPPELSPMFRMPQYVAAAPSNTKKSRHIPAGMVAAGGVAAGALAGYVAARYQQHRSSSLDTRKNEKRWR